MKDTNRLPLPSTKTALAAVCALLPGLLAQAQPVISGVYPNGTNQFQSASALTFNAASAAGVTNVSVQLTVTSLGGVKYLQTLSTGNGLGITGPATSQNVSAPLSSNVFYSAVIQATDAGGVSTISSVSFDTLKPSYTWEAEDWDYNSGKFIDNPQTNKYAGLASTSGTDYNNASPGSGNSSYRPQGMETETCGDVPRPGYGGSTNVDFDVGYATSGGWANYTRHYPAGLYNVYGRLADGNGATTDAGEFTVLSGNASLIGTAPFSFSVKSTGWQTYSFYPLLDANGTLVQFTNDGTSSTLQFTTVGGNYNVNFFMLVPANTNTSTAGATFSGIYPDGTVQFQNTNELTFTVQDSVGVTPNNITVQLSGTNLVGKSVLKLYTIANGLTTSGTADNLVVNVPLTSNTMYSAFLQAIDQNGNPSGTTVTFDTIVPFYTFEAEDYDYSGGLFHDNPQTNAYSEEDGVIHSDFYIDDPTSGNHSYRDNDNPTVGGPETEGCGDIPRLPFLNTGFSDYDVGFNDPANWENYTRHYPAGTYNIYMRAANGGGGAGSCAMAMVTSGLGTTNQSTTNLGTYTIPATGGWQSYVFCGLKDNSGNLIKVSLTGAATTLRVTGPSSCNANYYMLQPADTSLPIISNLYPNGVTLFQQTNTLGFYAFSSDGFNTNAITVTLNGASVPLTFSGSSTAWHVTYPHLQPNSVYNATLSATTTAGNTHSQSFTFDTYAANNYQWESGDYDYTSNGVSALFFDNPQIDRYNGLIATPGIDEQEVTGGAPISEDVYRPTPDGSTILVCTQGGGDAARPQFGSNPTWRINWFGFGDFCNYTRHYPAGTYNVVGRFTEGGANSSATLYKVTAGVGTTTQTTSLLGTFDIPVNGWNGWEYETLLDNANQPAVVTLDGSKTTLQLAGPLNDDGQTINAGFFMLLPVSNSQPGNGPTLTASLSSGTITISFPTVTGSNYQLQHNNSLGNTTWTNLGSALPGNNAVQSVQYPATGNRDFYRVKVQ